MAHITNKDRIKLDRPGTIGQIEQLAGIADRKEFWRGFYKPNHDYVADGMKALRKMAMQRVRNNELSLV